MLNSDKSVIINGSTQLLGVIGSPISHTKSPAMHNGALNKLKLNFVYLPFLVKPENLQTAIHAIKALNITGINVTIPHKESVIPFLDKLTDTAKTIGAVNTIINQDGKLLGHTTDPAGIVGALNKAGKSFNGTNVVILGSGGSARTAIFTALLNSAASITIAARNREKGIKLIAEVKKRFKKGVVSFVELGTASCTAAIAKATLLINSTSVGMGVLEDKSPVAKSDLHKKLTVFDMVYAPQKTKLLSDAKSIGAKTVFGIDMLIYQGIESFNLWTGKKCSYSLFKKGLTL